MSTPDRWSLLAGQDAWAASVARRPVPAEDGRRHESEMRVAHGCVPSMATQDVRNGAGIPPPDPGPVPGTVTG